MSLLNKGADATRRMLPTAALESTRMMPPLPAPAGHAHPTAEHDSGAQFLPQGTILQGRYLVEGTLGIGGMSIVYRGRDLRFKDVVRSCAIKEMKPYAPGSESSSLHIKTIEREAGILATLSHPAIPKVFDFFEQNNNLYLVLEQIRGHDLEAEIQQHDGPIDEARVAGWALQICDVLTFLHQQTPKPVIFRDLKPSNVMVTPEDRIILIDFGIARMVVEQQHKGTMIGTEGYAPPEQYRGIVDVTGDVYALGATLHHLLTGNDPRRETPFTFAERAIRQLNPQVSPEMETAVMQALAYDQAQRPRSIADLKALILRSPTIAGPPKATGVQPSPPVTVQPTPCCDIIWKVACTDEVRSSPTIAGDSVYVGSYDTQLYSLALDTGGVRWKRPTGGGISSSPVVWGDLVIVGSEDGKVYAFDTSRGTVRWTVPTAAPVRSSPRANDRILYVGSDDQHMYAIDAQNGRVLWKYRCWMPVRSSAAYAKEVLVFGSNDGCIYGIDAMKGGLRWKYKTRQAVISSPVIKNDLVYVGSMDDHLYALDLESGALAWKLKTNHYVNSSPIVDGNRVFVGGIDGNVYSVDAKTGKSDWKHTLGSQIASSVRLWKGELFVGSIDHQMYCLDAASGEERWRYATDGPIVSSPAIHQGLIVFGSLDHHVYAIRA
ncbi:MAG: PQQ-binding-like beta-propeller repeat protein [Herpetosiphon sp.]